MPGNLQGLSGRFPRPEHFHPRTLLPGCGLMKKYWKLLFFLVMVLLSAGYVWQVPSERNTLAILIRHQSQMEDFVQSVKAEATHPHDVLSAPDPLWAATPEGTWYDSVYTDDSIFPDQLVGRLLEWDFYTPDDCQPLPKEFQKRWQSLRRGRFTDFSCDVAKDGTVSAKFHREGRWQEYADGHYRMCNALIWLDADYPDPPESFWQPLTEQNGIVPSNDGTWYYAYEKHYDG